MRRGHMKADRYTVIYFILAILPLIAAVVTYGFVPETITVTDEITIATGRARIFILPIANLIVGGVLFFLFTKLEQARQKQDEETAQPPDMSNVFNGMKIYIILFFDVFCFCSIYGFYALDWGGTATAALMCRGAAAMLGVGGILIARMLPGGTKQSLIALRWAYTVKSDNVWYLTHKLGTKLFYFVGAFSILCAFIYSSYQAIIICALCYALVLLALYYYSRKLYFDEFR